VDVSSSQRLSIRKWELPRDLDDAFQIYGDAETMHFIPCGALSREQTQRLIERMIERDVQNGFGIWAVVHSVERRVIGASGVTYIPGHGTDIEIAWLFNKAYHGKGYATEAATAVMQHAFSQLGLRVIHALIERENAASIRVANRLRMDYDKIVRAYDRDLMRYSKTR
jgi:RimJ/RimL family protein N-acetyltransferase